MNPIYICTEDFIPKDEYPIFNSDSYLTKLYVSPVNDEHYDIETQQILIHFLIAQNRFPVHLTIELFSGVSDELKSSFQKQGISHSIINEQNHKSTAVFRAILENPIALSFALAKTFWIACANQFYAVSYPDSLSYTTVQLTGWFGRKKQLPRPHFNMQNPSSLIVIWHDGQGFNLYTCEEKYSTPGNLAGDFPSDTPIEFG
ncbi:hypothetical protein [Planococcus alpniumensis]|uniref:hypothetical protein n=1 Tax=Planococcus alpniumensis TaxID=2708345 RepID=UPI001B8AF913|nr:hypothetical protein [Planococcus sp. MSAK28401]